MGFFDYFTENGRKRMALEGKILEAEMKAAESTIDLVQNFVNPLEPFLDNQFGGLFLPLHTDHRARGDDPNFYMNQTQLQLIRVQGRRLAAQNEFAINALENLISHIVGSGMSYTVVRKEGSSLSDEIVDLIQGAVDEFLEANQWGLFEQEIVKRANRDGGCSPYLGARYAELG